MFLSSRYKGTPSPEVTVSICRVPSPEFSQAPEYIQLAHQCRFAVRSHASCSLEAFPGSPSNHFTALGGPMLWLEDSPADLPAGLLPSQTGMSNTRMIFNTPSPHRTRTWFRNINLIPNERRAGNLGLTASGLFTRFNVTHVSIRTSDTSSNPLESPSQAYRTLPYHLHCCKSALSVIDLAPLHLPRMRTRSVSYYAFFEGWLLLSQLPDCLSLHTSFST